MGPSSNKTGIFMRKERDPQGYAHTGKDHVKTQQECGCLQAKEKPNLLTFDLGIPASRTARNNILFCNPPSLWYFDMAALAD